MTKKPLTVQEMAAMGGKARAAALTPERRSEIGREAMAKRWQGHVKKVKSATGESAAPVPPDVPPES